MIFELNKSFFFLMRVRASLHFLQVPQSSLSRMTGANLPCQIVDVE
jgi:hypothetical protein